VSQHVRKLPATLKRSLTWDRKLEMAKQKEFTVAESLATGTNENTNLLLRQSFPRGTNLSHISQAQLDQVSFWRCLLPSTVIMFQKLRVDFAFTLMSSVLF
jgi:IS30 family transposase